MDKNNPPERCPRPKRCGYIDFSGAFLSVFVFAAISCSSTDRRISSGSFEAMRGFTFVGSGPYQAGASVPEGTAVLPKHGTLELTLRDRPEVGVAYIFHYPGVASDEDLAMVTLPANLKSANITVVSPPKATSELIYLFVGGPLFTLKIRDGGHEGIIFNRIDVDPAKSSAKESRLASEDYVLFWSK